MCDRVIVLENGRLAFDGPVDEGIKFLKYDDADDGLEPDSEDDLGDDSDGELGSDI